MQVFFGLDKIQKSHQPTVVTIGNFDGVHLGHQLILSELVRHARDSGAISTVVSFDPHPSHILRPAQKVPTLFSREDLVEQLSRSGVQQLVLQQFTEDFARLSALDFMKQLVGQLQPVLLIVGYDFSFGHQRSGNFESIREWGEVFHYQTLQTEVVRVDGEVVSSSRIRTAIADGEVDKAATFLGRSYFLEGRIVHGEGRGSKLGISTANLQPVGEVWPGRGVYLTLFECKGQSRPSLTNVGYKPTFHDHLVTTIETHVLNSSENYYDEAVRLSFIKKLRNEIKFSSVNELVAQIQSDLASAKTYFGV